MFSESTSSREIDRFVLPCTSSANTSASRAVNSASTATESTASSMSPACGRSPGAAKPQLFFSSLPVTSTMALMNSTVAATTDTCMVQGSSRPSNTSRPIDCPNGSAQAMAGTKNETESFMRAARYTHSTHTTISPKR